MMTISRNRTCSWYNILQRSTQFNNLASQPRALRLCVTCWIVHGNVLHVLADATTWDDLATAIILFEHTRPTVSIGVIEATARL